jgi:GT2 family glycosyltransferase
MSNNARKNTVKISVVIPTYRRERVLLDTVGHLLRLDVPPGEILIVDQTPAHEAATTQALERLEGEGSIRWIRLAEPSITHAMNVGLEQARYEVVLFLDDDIIPCDDLVAAHARAHADTGSAVVAGQVLQPGEEPLAAEPESAPFRFCSGRRQFISELMGGNFSIARSLALELGGFDENFVQVAYRFEAEFAARVLAAGHRILFEPAASIRHLKEARGGTRSYGQHLTTIRPGHSVGAYYYFLRSKGLPRGLASILGRPLRAIRTRHHLTRPWWIAPTLIAEALGFVWAVSLFLRGPRLIAARAKAAKQ